MQSFCPEACLSWLTPPPPSLPSRIAFARRFARLGLAWFGVCRLAWRGVAWRGMAWRGMAWHWRGLAGLGLTWLGSWLGVWRGVAWLCLAWHWLGLALLGLAWLGLAWLGLAWLGWLGLAWLGLAWLGLTAWAVGGGFRYSEQAHRPEAAEARPDVGIQCRRQCSGQGTTAGWGEGSGGDHEG